MRMAEGQKNLPRMGLKVSVYMLWCEKGERGGGKAYDGSKKAIAGAMEGR